MPWSETILNLPCMTMRKMEDTNPGEWKWNTPEW